MKKSFLKKAFALATSLTIALSAAGIGTFAAEEPENDTGNEVITVLNGSADFSISPTSVELNLNPNKGTNTFTLNVSGPSNYTYDLLKNSSFASEYVVGDSGIEGFKLTALKNATASSNSSTHTLWVNQKSGSTIVDSKSVTVKVTCTHEFGETKVINPPTCKTKGSGKAYCKYCNYTRDVPLKAEHNYVQTITKQPTCTEKGLADLRCATCKTVKTNVEIPALDHNFVTSKTVPATCEAAGYTEYKCTRCTATKTVTNDEALSHNWVQTGTTAATCTADGHTDYKCTRCNKTKQDTITSPGHDFSVYVRTVNAGCTTDGYTEYKCSRCTQTEKRNVVKSTGHSYTSKVTVPATTTSTGVMTYTCTKCNDTYTSTIPVISTQTVTKGDMNGDKLIDMKDLALLQQYLAKWKVTIDLAASDLNADKSVDMKDLALLQQYLAHWEVSFK